MIKKSEYNDEIKMKPSYFLCGAGGEINCHHFDEINGCWMNAKHYGDDFCDPPADIEEEEDNLDSIDYE